MDPHNQLQISHYKTAFDREFQISSLGSRDNRNALGYITAIMSYLSPALSEGGALLEIGTGTGFHAQVCIERFGARYAGCDISISQLRRTRRRFERAGRSIALVCCEGERLPFRRNSLAAVFLSGTLHHVSNPAACVAACAAVIRPGGRLALMEPNPWFAPNALFGLVLRVERNMFKMGLKSLSAFCQSALLEVSEAGYRTYTPPYPRFLGGVYDLIDRVFARLPLLRRLSVMLYCFAHKPE